MIDWIAIYMRMMELIYRRADEFDVLHFHTDYFPLSLFSRQRTPFLTTLHGRLDIPEFKDVYELFDAPFVSISDSQRRPIPRLNWIRTVHHGMPAESAHAAAREAGSTWRSSGASRRKRAWTRRFALPAPRACR